MGKLGSKLGKKFKFWVSPISRKILVFENTLNKICETMRTACDQNFTSIWPCLLKLFPQNHSKRGQLGPEPKK